MKSYLSLLLATLFVRAASTESNLRGVVDGRELIKGNGPQNAPDGTFAACNYDCVKVEVASKSGAFGCAEYCVWTSTLKQSARLACMIAALMKQSLAVL